MQARIILQANFDNKNLISSEQTVRKTYTKISNGDIRNNVTENLEYSVVDKAMMTDQMTLQRNDKRETRAQSSADKAE